MDYQRDNAAHDEKLSFARLRTVAAPQESYSRFVKWMKIILPLTAAGLLLVLFFWPTHMNSNVTTTDHTAATKELVMDQPHYSGMDSKNEPFTVIAEKAVQSPNALNVVNMSGIKAEVFLNNGNKVAMIAKNGSFDQDHSLMSVEGDVHFNHNGGYRFVTESMQVDFTKNTATSKSPVTFNGSFGEIHGSGFELHDGGKVIIFTGPARAKISSGARQKSGAAAEAITTAGMETQ